MCGRFALRLNRNEIRQLPGYDLDADDWENEDQFVPRYNIAPRTQVPVLRRRDNGPNDHPELMFQTMKWGLVPHWSKFEDKTLSTTNARAENLVEGGGMWGSLRGTKRCVIPCQGYYEWLTKGKQKLPHFTKRQDGKLMLLAGLYDSAVIEDRTLWTFSIVTTDANSEFSWLHDRQPVILPTTQAVIDWLDTSSRTWNKHLTNLVQPYHDSDVSLQCYQVPLEVGRVGVESPTFIEPISMRKDGIQAMFSKQKRDRSPVQAKGHDESAPQKRTRSPSLVKANDETSSKKFKQEVKPGEVFESNPAVSQDRKKASRKTSPKKAPSQTPSDIKPITSFFAKRS